jgi:uncharacterized membrane protein YjjP (DUF1212 family)
MYIIHRAASLPHGPHVIAPFDARATFLTELARRLHVAGVAASRLEGAVLSTARALDISCEIWSAPTGLLLSLGDVHAPAAPQHTRVLRLEPGNVDLSALVTVDRIAEDVIAGRLAVADASAALHALDRTPTRGAKLRAVFAFGLAAAAVAGLLRTSWLDVTVAGALGLIIGAIAIASFSRPHLRAASEALAALVATVLAGAFAHFVAPLSVQTVVIAAVIVLMPGLTLTTAVAELASQQLVTGTTRFAGALVVLLKLTFGSVAGTQVVTALGWSARAPAPSTLPPFVEIIAMIAAAYSFAILFRAERRDYPLVMVSAVLGYLLTRVASSWTVLGQGATFAGAVFFSSLVMAALANLYGRLARRPGALVRVPGIMLMVPGSVGFRSLAFVMQRDYTVGLDTGVAVLSALIALMAGLLFGSLIVPPRRYL